MRSHKASCKPSRYRGGAWFEGVVNDSESSGCLTLKKNKTDARSMFIKMYFSSLFLALFSLEKRRLCYRRVCLPVSQFSREPCNTWNLNFQRRPIYTYDGSKFGSFQIKFVKKITLRTSLTRLMKPRFHFHNTAYCVYLHYTMPTIILIYVDSSYAHALASNRCDHNSMRPATEWISQHL